MSQMLTPHPGDYWTINDLSKLPDSELRIEILDGQLVMVPAPSAGHQSIVDRLRDHIKPALDSSLKYLEGGGINMPPSYRIPDLMVFRSDAFDPNALSFEPADVVLAVEVVSPSSQTTDRITKPAQYAAAGIPHYWRIETENGVALTAYDLHSDVYAEVGTWASGETAILQRPFAITLELAALAL